MATDQDFKIQAERYYSGKLETHGRGHLAVDWNSPESQRLRFKELLMLAEPNSGMTINDFGCGYGALVDYLDENFAFEYFGFDISSAMIEEARRAYGDRSNVQFTTNFGDLLKQDYTVASGVFNVKQDAPREEWERYIERTLEDIATVSAAGFSFNMLTSYSDTDRMRDDLYYGNPMLWFDLCKARFSQNVAVLHDYGLYEFTILVRNL